MPVFERPAALIFLLAFPALALARRFLRLRGFSPGFPFDDSRIAPFFMPMGARALGLVHDLALGAAITASVIAAAGPALSERRLVYTGPGNEVIFVIDVSPSMAASDFPGSRLEAAKAIVGRFLATRRNETVGLVAFGGEAALICPPTRDYASLASRLAELSPGLFGDGTAVGSGIATALVHAARSRAPEKHIILLTDGENNAGAMDPASAAGAALRAGMSLSVIGVGSEGEVPVVYIDPASGKQRSGIYKSGFDDAALERLSVLGGGAYYAARNQSALEAAFEALSERSDSLAQGRTLTRRKPLAAFFLALALAFAILARLAGLAGGASRP